MNPTGKIVSLIHALMLLACACFAGFEVFGFAFAMGESGAPTGLVEGAFLIVTLLGAVGLVIGALGTWSRWPVYSTIPLVSTLCVLPAAGLFCWQQSGAFWHNTQVGFSYGPSAWASVLLPVPLDLAALLLSGLRFRRFSRSVPKPSIT